MERIIFSEGDLVTFASDPRVYRVEVVDKCGDIVAVSIESSPRDAAPEPPQHP